MTNDIHFMPLLNLRSTFFCILEFYVLSALLLMGHAHAAEQSVNLKAGWNAVYLELQPDVADPAVVFDDPAIVKVAMWLPTKAQVGSLTALDAVASKPSAWRVWQPAEAPAAFLNDLFRVQARSAFLIEARVATTLTFTGEPFFERKKWLAPSFNLTGFDVDPAAAPTFQRYFDGSRAHSDLKIFKLVENT